MAELARKAVKTSEVRVAKFFTFDQNNSGGRFIENHKAGITHRVIIQAFDHEEANRRAEEIGIYFDDDYFYDCRCCGQRWYRTWKGEATDVPEVYGQDVSGGVYFPSAYHTQWTEAEAYIHYLSGKIVRVDTFVQPAELPAPEENPALSAPKAVLESGNTEG